MKGINFKDNLGPITPAALKAGFQLSSPALPEQSMLGDSQLTSMDQTPMPIAHSSSSLSTPMPALPQRGELGLASNGNLLTLKEQEAKLEQLDKENFGLKLKIHFLEEHLNKSGSEFNQQTIKQNTELRANQIILDRDIKRYLKQLRNNEAEIEQYRLQLEQFRERMKSRHMNEAMRDELESFKETIIQREKEIIELKTQIEERHSEGHTEELDAAQTQSEELEEELRAKQRELDEKDDRIEELEAQLRDAQDDDGEEGAQKDEKIELQDEQIQELQKEVQQLREERDELDEDQESIESLRREHEAEMRDIRNQLEVVQREKRDQLQQFESKLTSTLRDKDAELDSVRRKLQTLNEEKASEIESLQTRLKLAQSSGDDQSRLAQQAAEEAQEKLRLLTIQKDEELDDLRAQVDEMQGKQDEIDILEHKWHIANKDKQRLEQQLEEQNHASAELRHEMAEKERVIRVTQSPSKILAKHNDQIDKLQRVLTERTSKIVELQQTIDAQNLSLEELSSLRVTIAELTRRLDITSKESKSKQATITDRDRQLETLQKSLNDRNSELEILRNAVDEPHSQLEGLTSIVRHRDEDLTSLRKQIIDQQNKFDVLQRLAEERLRLMAELQAEFANEKQDLQDEIEVLECSLDEAEEKVANLVKKLQNPQASSPRRTAQLERKARLKEQECQRLQEEIDELRRDQGIDDADRLSLRDTVTKLHRDLKAAQDNAKAASPLPKGTTMELKSLRLEQHDLQQRLIDAETALEHAEIRHREVLQEKTRQNHIELKNLRQVLREKESQLADLEQDTMRHVQAGAKAQTAREEAGRLSAHIVDMERKHIAEIKGLVKQIQVLRVRLDREKMFRNELAFQKRWFLMMVDMYDTW